ncbi:MAG: HTH-type transcriptional regulator/antitoxin HigA [Limisphaerales bacterium]|jgi:HTH-type transcriptional regulator/antitoxin HigA
MKPTRRKTNWKFAELPKEYVGLCRVLLPRPIRSVAESDEAYELASVMAGHRLTKDQDDYLEALSTFIEQYEDKANPESKKKTPTHEMLRYLCEENGMSGVGLGRLLEVDRTLATRILRGERNLTVSHIQKICKRFKLSADRFINR